MSLLRWQITIVYMFAALRKLHPQWTHGTIAAGIFLSFEQADVASGVPWPGEPVGLA